MNNKSLFDVLESYGFKCKAGPLEKCQDWQDLRGAIEALLHTKQVPPIPDSTAEYNKGAKKGFNYAIKCLRVALTRKAPITKEYDEIR